MIDVIFFKKKTADEFRISDWSSDVCSSDLQGSAPSNIMIPGRYILQPEVMRILETQEKGAGGEIQLTDAMARMIGTQPFHAFTFGGKRYDCGDTAGYIQAKLEKIGRASCRERVCTDV